MKKNEIKKDPIRDFILDLISKIKEKWQNVLMLIVGVLIIVPLSLSFYGKDSESDYLDCLISDISINIDSLNDYCSSQLVLDSISENHDLKLSSNKGIFMFIKDLQNIDLKEKSLKMQNSNLSDIKNNLIRARFYELFADILMNLGEFSDSEKNYLKALDLSDSKFYSALIKFKLSQVLFSGESFEKAYNYTNEALEYDFEDQSIVKEIEILKGRIMQVMSRL